MFSFASKMLNTIMGTEEGQPGQVPGPGQQQYGMQQTRPLVGFQSQVRPGQQVMGTRPFTTPSFTGPRPNAIIRGGPPSLGASTRPMGGPGAPHRFNGPQLVHPIPQNMQPSHQPGQGGIRGPVGTPGMQSMGMRQRAPQPRQAFPQKIQAQNPPAGAGTPGLDLDLSHLSAEERKMIESVMAKAQQLEQEVPPGPVPSMNQPGSSSQMMRADDPRQLINQSEEVGRLCPLCRQRDISGRDGHPPHECAECHNLVCNRCGGIATHPETKRPEWTCGGCIKRRRIMAQGGGQMQQNLTQQPQRQSGLYGAYPQQTSGMDWENGRHESGGHVGMGAASSSGGSRERLEAENNTEPIESKARVEKDQSYNPSSTIPFQNQISPEYYEELDHSSQSISSVDYFPSFTNPEPQVAPGTFPSMNTPQPALARDAKPSLVKLRSRSASLDVSEEDSQREENGYGSTSYNGRVDIPAAPENQQSDHLMEEFSKLQSAVESYSVKRKEREYQQEPSDLTLFLPSPTPPSPMRSPSPKPSPPKSLESISPLPSPISLIQTPGDSPESPESQFPAPRKAIVMKENDLDDYKSSTDEETDSDSDEEQKIIPAASGEVTNFYDHSPGEVYTIPEEEDEGGSPTGADLVTSLNRPGVQGQDIGSPRRRMMAQECLPANMGMMHDQRIRPQLRSQHSLENRMSQAETVGQTDMQGNMSYNRNLNTQMQNQLGIDNQAMMGHGLGSTTQPTTGLLSNTGSLLQTSFHSAPIISASTIQPHQQSLEALGTQGSSFQQYQVHQKPTDCSIEWNNNLSHTDQSRMGGGPYTDSMSVATSLGQAYQNVQNQPLSMEGQFQQQQQQLNPSQQQQIQQTNQQQQQQLNQTQHQQQQLPMQMSQQQQVNQTQNQQLTQHQQQQIQNQQQFLNQQQNLTNQIQMQNQYQGQQQSRQLPGSQSNQFPIQQSGQPLPSNQQQSTQYVNAQQNLMQPTQSTQIQGFHTPQQQMISNIAQPSIQQQHIDTLSSQSSQSHQTGISPQQLSSMLNEASNYSNAQQMPLDSLVGYDTSGRLGNSPCPSPFSQNNQNMQLQQYQQQLNQQNMSQQQYPHMSAQQQLMHTSSGVLNVPGQPNVITTNAGASANKSISGLIADFSRALGLGNTPPRPSPSDERSELFPTRMSHEDGLSSYEQYMHQPLMTTQAHLSQSQQQQQQSAFTPIQDMDHIYSQQSNQQHGIAQHLPAYLTQAAQSSIQPGIQNIQYGVQSLPTSQQQYLQNFASQQTTGGVMGQGIIHPIPTLGVGLGPVSPAQAHMYQQQMALQHQAQHMKKSSRRAHSTGSEMRKDTVLIGQNLTMGPGGMTIGTLTPAVVTSLGTFIGGGSYLGPSLLQQPLAVTPLGTPIGTPVGTPRSGREPCTGDSSDTMSETDSQKSLRMRRKLPCLPPDQEAAPLPSSKKRDRQRLHEFRSLSPMRVPASESYASRPNPLTTLGLSRPSASESNLRRITMGTSDIVPRPGSALGLLQGSSIVSSIGGKMDSVYPVSGNLFSTTSVLPGIRFRSPSTGISSAELAACLPPDLRHLLSKGDNEFSELSDLSGLTSSLGETSLNVGSHLPSYMKTIREQLQEERRQLLSEERRRLELLRERDRELGARLDAVTSRAGTDSLRSRADVTKHWDKSRSTGASPVMSRKLEGHHRQLSDPKLSLPFSPIKEDGELPDFERGAAGILKHTKSYEYESLESALADWDHSESYLNTSWANVGGVLRETAIHSLGSAHEGGGFSRLTSSYLSRRGSEGEPWSPITRQHSSSRDKRHHFRKHRKSRSWNPSPYVSEEDDEDDDITREEKKARIKAEIAKRRQQMQERGSLHQDYGSRISKLHESSGEEHSVLKSVDQLIRDQLFHDEYGPYTVSQPSYSFASMYPTRESHQIPGRVPLSPCPSEEDRSIERIASTFGAAEDYSYLLERLGEVSPGENDLLGGEIPMPLLEDMPTRSRRLLEDLGCPVPLSHTHQSDPTSGIHKGKYTKPGLNQQYRNVL